MEENMFMSMNLIALVYQNIPDMCSSIEVLYQNTVLEDSYWGGLLLGGDEAFGVGGEGCVPMHLFLCGSGERSCTFVAEETHIPRSWHPVLKPISRLSCPSTLPRNQKTPSAWMGRLLTFLL